MYKYILLDILPQFRGHHAIFDVKGDNIQINLLFTCYIHQMSSIYIKSVVFLIYLCIQRMHHVG